MFGWGSKSGGLAASKPLVRAAPGKAAGPGIKWVLLAAAAAMALEASGFAMLPLKAWMVCSHEFFHALAGWLTGGQVQSLRADGEHGGVTYTSGGIYPLISCAGYLGCGLFGAACLRFSSSRGMALAFQAFCAALAAALVAKGSWTTGYGWGMAQALGVDALALLAARRGKAQFVLALCGCLFLAMGFDDVRVLLFYATSQTDAGLLARWMGMPFLAWPIALGYACAMAAMWWWAVKGLAKRARGAP